MDPDAVHIPEDLHHSLIHLGGRGNGGIAQAVVKHVLRPHHLGLLQAILKQVPDHRTVGAQGPHFFRYHVVNASCS